MKTLTQDQLRCMEVIRFLREDESRWCRSAMARTKKGFPCSPNWPRAMQWCFVGAWAHLYATMDVPKAQWIAILNDQSESLDRAIAKISRLFDLP